MRSLIMKFVILVLAMAVDDIQRFEYMDKNLCH
jgi:hypothetical protein